MYNVHSKLLLGGKDRCEDLRINWRFRLPTYVGQLLCEGDDKTNCFEGDDLQNVEGGKKEKLGPRKTLSKDEGRGLKLF